VSTTLYKKRGIPAKNKRSRVEEGISTRLGGGGNEYRLREQSSISEQSKILLKLPFKIFSFRSILLSFARDVLMQALCQVARKKNFVVQSARFKMDLSRIIAEKYWF